jgi:hypothetical protein
MLHSPWITRSVITDHVEALSKYYDIIVPYKKEFGQPFSLKLQLPKFSPFTETLYIDSDSLVMNNINSLWDFLNNRSFAYEGKMYTNGVWYYDISKIMTQLNVRWIPKFNSGMFLFRKDEISRNIFDTAYALMTGENTMGIGYFRGTMRASNSTSIGFLYYFFTPFLMRSPWGNGRMRWR